MPIITTIQALQLSKNFPDLRINEELAPVSVNLTQSGVQILDEQYMNDTGNGFTLKLKSLIHSALSVPAALQNSGVYELSDNLSDFVLTVAGIPVNFRAVKAGVAIDNYALQANYADIFLKSNFLSWQPQNREVTNFDKQILCYYAQSNCVLNWQVQPLYHSWGAQLEAGKCYRIEINRLLEVAGSSSVKIWVEYADHSKSKEQLYTIIQAKSNETDVFIFENSLGGLDTVEFTGTLTESDNHDIQNALINDEIQEYDIDYQRIYTKNTGFIATESERVWLRDFYTSLQKWHYTGGILRRIFLKSWENESQKGELNQANFKFSYAKDDGLNNIV